jgi:hypothetical protein
MAKFGVVFHRKATGALRMILQMSAYLPEDA